MKDEARGIAVSVSRKLPTNPANAEPAINKVPIKALAVPALSGKMRMLFPKHWVKVMEPLMKTKAVGRIRFDSERAYRLASQPISKLPQRAAIVAVSIKGNLGNH